MNMSELKAKAVVLAQGTAVKSLIEIGRNVLVMVAVGVAVQVVVAGAVAVYNEVKNGNIEVPAIEAPVVE